MPSWPGASLTRLLPLLAALALTACFDSSKSDDDDDGTETTDGADGADGTDRADGTDGTDGTDGSDGTSTAGQYGPDNAWWHADADDVPSDLSGTGTSPGDVFGNFTLPDQFGDDVELYQFYGQVVQIVLVAEWCGICRDEAPEIDGVYQDLQDDAVILTILLEDSAGSAPDSTTAARWADELGVTGPVLADETGALYSSVRGGYPTLPLLDRQMVIETDDNFPFSEGPIEALIAE